ncbi:hypothetical protein DFH09DRAFT_1079816 [Mycena vulgaris]|nr:hypothetical protein DFH09DRAFT_1079816 [Mycena vulgaris]
MSTPEAGPLVLVEIVVDANGYTICPDCEEAVHCGLGGLRNCGSDMGSNSCREVQAKKPTTPNKPLAGLRGSSTQSRRARKTQRSIWMPTYLEPRELTLDPPHLTQLVDASRKNCGAIAEDRGVREQEDFSAMIQQMLRAMEFLRVSGIHIKPTASGLPLATSTELFIPAASTDISRRPESDSENWGASDLIRASRAACQGSVFPLGRDWAISTAYPILLHEVNLPWDFADVVSCISLHRPGHSNRTSCADLEKNSMLKGIISRSEEGVHENANLMDQPPGGPTAIQRLRLGLLTNSRDPLTQTKSLSDHKRFVIAIRSGKAQQVDQVVGACIKQKQDLRGMLNAYWPASVLLRFAITRIVQPGSAKTNYGDSEPSIEQSSNKTSVVSGSFGRSDRGSAPLPWRLATQWKDCIWEAGTWSQE